MLALSVRDRGWRFRREVGELSDRRKMFVQQPCSNPSKSPEHLSKAPTQEFSCFAAILQTPERFSKVSCRLCTAEVRGSTPLGSTPRKLLRSCDAVQR
jgi:hypothetical protein